MLFLGAPPRARAGCLHALLLPSTPARPPRALHRQGPFVTLRFDDGGLPTVLHSTGVDCAEGDQCVSAMVAFSREGSEDALCLMSAGQGQVGLFSISPIAPLEILAECESAVTALAISPAGDR